MKKWTFRLLFLWCLSVSHICMSGAVLISPFGQRGGLSLSANASHQKGLRDILLNRGLSERVNLRETAFEPSSSFLSSFSSYTFEKEGYPFCLEEVKVYVLKDGSPYILGQFPIAGSDTSPDSNLPIVEALRRVEDYFDIQSDPKEFSLMSQRNCWFQQGSEFFLLWELVVTVDGFQYYLLVDSEKIWYHEPRHFHGTGTSKIYPNNSLDQYFEQFSFSLDDSALLKNAHFEVVVDPSIFPVVSSVDFDFFYSPETSEFSQTSVFTNANRMLRWLISQGYENFGSETMELHVHQTLGGDKNNAVYQPATDFSSPSILVGDGDGVILKNLATDLDVVAHELGHHVIFHHLKSTTGESLVIHEGLADYFTYAMTGNSCLGESICPENSPLCAVDQKCLRTADNDITYLGVDYPYEPHLQSQVISGFLWDLTSKDEIPADTVTSLVLGSISLMVADSGFLHLFLGLVTVDQENHDGAHCSLIFERAKARGFGEILAPYKCASIDSSTISRADGTSTTSVSPSQTRNNTTNDAQSSQSTSKSKSKGSPQCGAIMVGDHVGTRFLLVLLLFLGWLGPLLMSVIFRLRSAAKKS